MAAEVLLGYELDTFQRVRLRDYWWVPNGIDSSGISTGKTLTDFIYVALRCTLIPDHWAGVYFPTFATGRDEFWPYFQQTYDRSRLFRAQCLISQGKPGKANQGAYLWQWKSGSRCIMPAPSWQQDSVNQAGRRFNTLVVDEWLQAILQGDGIAKQLIARVTRASYNKYHPLWCNHIKYLGHAASPSHKGHATYQEYRRAIRKGSTRHFTISFCYRDHTKKYARFVEHNVIAELRRTLTRDEFARQVLGLWTADGEGIYPEVILNRCRRAAVRVLLRRALESDHYFLGQDVAIGKSKKADLAASVVVRAKPVLRDTEANFRYGDSLWWLEIVFARALKNRTTKQLAGFIYWLDQQFRFDHIVTDPGGGGIGLYDDLQERTQEINGQPFDVLPFCEPTDPLAFQKRPIFTFAKQDSLLALVMNPHYLRGAEGLVDGMHTRYAAAWTAQEIAVPVDLEDLAPAVAAQFTPAEQEIMRELTLMRHEMRHVRAKVDRQGQKATSSKGFTMYESRQKKDRAYAAVYAFMAMLVWMQQHVDPGGGGDDETVSAG